MLVEAVALLIICTHHDQVIASVHYVMATYDQSDPGVLLCYDCELNPVFTFSLHQL